MVGKSFEAWEAEQPLSLRDWMRQRPELHQDVLRLAKIGKDTGTVRRWLIKEHQFPDTKASLDFMRNLMNRNRMSE